MPVTNTFTLRGKRYRIAPIPSVHAFADDGLYHGSNPPPGWKQVGTGPKGGKIWGPPDKEKGGADDKKKKQDAEDDEFEKEMAIERAKKEKAKAGKPAPKPEPAGEEDEFEKEMRLEREKKEKAKGTSEKPAPKKDAPPSGGSASVKDLADHSAKWQESVPPDLLNAVAVYTGKGYKNMNKGLRTGTFESPPPDAKAVAEKTAAALDTASLPDQVNAYRSINAGSRAEQEAILKQFKDNIGGHIIDKAFVSTTVNKGVADDWGAVASNPIQCVMVLPKGAKAAYVTGKIESESGEHEVLVQKNSKFKVHSVEGNVIKLELVP